ncbi:nSTAND1 domain-containing NTPase [Anabaena subtropica]|uniref:Caspase family protein n=1 Tax=Anabaena subtropica FACHB-260 TaxID=2692884 RepID=A0ABR8CPI7_9NOST|nr:caspase family protein [Anabaena subtropica]MBD2344390.1 caspase family protein [Anabaena subtropica FACHB-260]
MPRAVATSSLNQTKNTVAPKLWLLLVGVNEYQDQQLPCLRYSAIDCQVLAEALTSATQEQFSQKQIQIHHDFAKDLPLLADVCTSLQQITASAQPADTILFYFSGHGVLQPNTQQAYLCLADTQKDDLENTGLAVQELLQFLSNSGVQNQLVWLDACHSGGMTLRGLNPTPQLVAVLQQRAANSKGFYALLSCDTDQQSWEFPELGHGVFTYYLMRGLRGDAADHQGVISADGLYRYVYHQTLQYIDKTNQQLRLINQQKRGKGDTELYSEYPLQTPKRIVEGIGELIIGRMGAIAPILTQRKALIIEGISGSQVALDFCKILGKSGNFTLEYLTRSTTTTTQNIRETIKECLRSHNQLPQYKTTEPVTVLLYLRGRLEETPTGEAALVLLDDIWLSRSWIKQQLRRSSVTQQIIILDCPDQTNSVYLQDWVEDLQLSSDTGQCIIAAACPKNNPEIFAQALIETLKAASAPIGLSVATWITQLQIHLATQTPTTPSLPLHIWLSGTQGVIEIIPAITSARSNQKSVAFDLKICPYRGLQAFGEEDTQYFYGRESLIQQLISRLAHKPFLAVVGASGSGKSSIVQAGLIAQLRPGKQLPGSDSWLIKSIRPGARPLEALAQRLGEVKAGEQENNSYSPPSSSSPPTPYNLLEAMLYQGVEGFVYWLRSRPEPMVVLVVDQFEELFTLAPSEDRQRFLELLLGAVEYAADKFKVVVTVRADFISPCLAVPALASLLQQSSVLVPPNLSDDDYRRVIINPAEQVALKVEPGLVEVLLQELNHSAGDLPLLEFVLEQLWEHRQAGELTLAAYQQQIGGIKGALERKAQEIYESLDSKAQECARWIFLSLTQLGEGTEDTRRRIWKSELVVKKYSDELVERTLLALTTAKLVVVNLEEETREEEGPINSTLENFQEWWTRGKGKTSSPTPQSRLVSAASVSDTLCERREPPLSTSSSSVTIEVAHEILIRHWSTLRWWLEENRSRLRSQRQIEQAAALWKHHHQQPDFLLQGIRLAEAEELYVKYTDELSQDVQNFIAACLEARQQQQLEQKKRLRQAQRAVAIISVLGITASGFGGFAYWQKRAAQLREIAALNASSEAFILSNQQLESIIASIKATKELRQVFAPTRDIQIATAATFQQAIANTQEINRLQKHTQQVNAVSFSPNGKIIASASDDNTIKIWDIKGQLITTLKEFQNRVTAIAFSPNGKYLATASADPAIKLYSFNTSCLTLRSIEKCLKLIKTFTGHTDIVTDVSFSPDSKIIASASLDKTVKLWRIDGSLINGWNAHNGWVNSIIFSPDGKHIASGGEDNLVKLWQTLDSKLIKTFTGHKGRITRVKFNPNGNMIASASGDTTIKIWQINGKLLQSLASHNQQVNSIQFNADGQILASAGADSTIKIWHINGQLVKNVLGNGAQFRDVNFSSDNKFIVSASSDKTVRLWQLNYHKSQTSHVNSISFHPDGKKFAAAGWDGKVTIWQKAKSSILSLSTIKTNQNIIEAVSFSHNGKILATASADNTIKLWNNQTQELIKTLTGHQDRVTSISFSHDNQTLASGSADKTIKIWRVSDGKLLRIQTGHNDEVTSVSFSPDGQLLASGSADNTVKIWGVDGNLVKNLTGHGLAIASVKFSPDSQILASASWDNTIKLWQVPDGKLINNLTAHTDGVTSLSFSPDGQILASASADNTIKLWNITNARLLKTLLGHPSKINTVSFSPDGKALVSGGENTGVMMWNLDLDDLMQQGCDRITDYLQHNGNVNPGDGVSPTIGDRSIC